MQSIVWLFSAKAKIYSLESNLLLRPATPPLNIDINKTCKQKQKWNVPTVFFNWGSKSWTISVPFFGFFHLWCYLDWRWYVQIFSLECGLHLSLSHDLNHGLEQWEVWAELQAAGNVEEWTLYPWLQDNHDLQTAGVFFHLTKKMVQFCCDFSWPLSPCADLKKLAGCKKLVYLGCFNRNVLF